MTRLLLSILIFFLTSAAFAQGTSPLIVVPDTGHIYAYAANNRLIGAFTPVPAERYSIGGMIRMEVLEEGLIYLPVTRIASGLVWDAPAPFFESTDCTGQPWGPTYVKSVGDRVAFVGFEGRLYIGNQSGTSSAMKMLRSTIALREDGSKRCDTSQNLTTGVIPLREVAKLDDTFPPPFELDARSDRVRAVRH